MTFEPALWLDAVVLLSLITLLLNGVVWYRLPEVVVAWACLLLVWAIGGWLALTIDLVQGLL